MVLPTKRNRGTGARGNTLIRHITNNQADLCDSPDSGYGSSGNYVTPRSQTGCFRRRAFCDGNDSGNNSPTDGSIDSPLALKSERFASRRVASLPAIGHNAWRQSQQTPTRDENKIYPQQYPTKLGNGSSPRTVDRFVPLRERGAQVTERYRTGKPVRSLSNLERLLRHDAVSRDPFAPPTLAPTVILSRERDTAGSRSLRGIQSFKTVPYIPC